MMAWWTDQDAGWIGAIAGSSIGILGGLLGGLAGTFAPKGKYKSLVLSIAFSIALFGVISFGAGIYAFTQSQPFFVCYPLLLLGLVCCSVIALIPVINKRYREAENRRLEAEEFRRS
ncbi:hypothetical protein KIH39_11710 [Telmatocola sphagniphila]|uniref:Uncharacterized protein n=1 Tax=Telmatocola sphagniphila TaxID=1123043 RepID=A0A8E6BAZ8_9BACT|nr:hypothetical protein [Telmatocola sphagniphila]QVL34539.1 hypothetical protein KIH39_11710 [Telmatocola sphagniphila]